jgi:two-component system invasion response regulator UvrY
MIRVLLVDDHELARTGMRRTLQDTHDIEVIAEAKSGEEAVLLAQQLKPDVMLMDLNMPGTDGFSASVQLLHNHLSIKILIISGREDNMLIPHFSEMGVCGYISKNTPPETLKKIIRAIYAGEKCFNTISATPISPFAMLSDRELQIALMVARGMESQEIAERLFLSKKTVHGYHRDLLKKLGLKKDVELARLILQYGLIDLDSVRL